MRLTKSVVLIGVVWAVLVMIGGVVAAALDAKDDDTAASDTPGNGSVVVASTTTVTTPSELVPYIDAVVTATSPGLAGLAQAAGIDDAPYRCTVQKMLEAVTLPRLQSAGATPESLGEFPNLASAGFTLDAAAAQQLTTDAGSCGVATYTAQVLISGLTVAGPDGNPLASADGTNCFVNTMASDPTFTPALVDQLLGVGDPSEAINTATVSAYAGCPTLLVDLLVQIYAGTGLTVSDDARACITTETTDRAEAVATAVVDQDQAATRQLGTEIGEACSDQLGG